MYDNLDLQGGKSINEEAFVEFGFVLVTIDHQEVTKELGLLIFPQEDKSTPIFFACLPNNTYKRRNGTTIKWWQSNVPGDCLLIFKDEICCSYIWGIIVRMQRDWHFTNQGGSLNSGIGALSKLGPVNLSDQMHIAELIARDNIFFRKLVRKFKIYEDSKNIDGLHVIYQSVRGIILLSNLSVFDRIFSREYLMDVVGALEYDPEKPMTVKGHHHSLLETAIKEHVIFKEDLVKNKSVLTKLYQSFVAGYIKDVIPPRTLDEVTIASLTLYVHAKDAVIFSKLLADSRFIQELLAKLKSDGIPLDSKRDLVRHGILGMLASTATIPF
ncbi:Serine/threonine-protein phosphatase 4 regulatory subunit 3 [Rhynchospora pubera]|uniref:Serine/threonine-protein phosphatase 4 regulatory subunit 3 n=1 Tax=Rhynchospora pubera TaxID=906938 RepID=A0AAV8EY20_9POAL|nr:Serine/threonine-protein phosphatase 4 regulatory subunit 3 [Rhynchospora pubera]